MLGNQSLPELEKAMIEAHGKDDACQLVGLYSSAGDIKEKAGDIDAACFYFTHAYVFALETGHKSSQQILGKLVRHGRDAFPENDT